VVAAAVAACGRPGSPTSQDAGTRATAGGAATVRVYFTGSPRHVQLLEDLKLAYERAYPKYTVDLVQGPDEIQKLLVMLAGGEPVDTFWNMVRNSWWLMRGQEGALLDLLPLAKRDKLGLDDFWPSAIKAHTYKGGFFTWPHSASSNAVYYNKEHFRRAGVPFPHDLEQQGRWDWEALVDAGRRLTGTDAVSGQQRFGFGRIGGLILTVQYMWQNGGKPVSDDRRQCLLPAAENVTAVQFVVDLVRKHQVSPPIGAEGNPGFETDFRISMVQAGRYFINGLVPALDSGSLDAGMVVAPRGARGNQTRGDDMGCSIISSSKAVDATWEFAKLWSSPDPGQVLTLKSNVTYTSRRSVARNPAVLKEVLYPWEDMEEYYKGLMHGEPFPVTARFPDVMNVYGREENLAYQGTKAVKQAMDDATTEIAPLLSER
jgi:multiple sugar transport system substrate-binding protein